MRPTLRSLLLLSLAASPLAAAPAVIDVRGLPCVPRERNSVVYATVSPNLPQYEARLYFRRDGHGDPYFMVMTKFDDKGHYFAVLPKPDRQNEQVEYHVQVRGIEKETLASSPILTAPVSGDCKVELTKQQEDMSNELRVGETRSDQKGRPVAWWLCDGIVERIDIFDQTRPDEFCAVPPGPVPIVTAGVPAKGLPVPLPPEPSPARP